MLILYTIYVHQVLFALSVMRTNKVKDQMTQSVKCFLFMFVKILTFSSFTLPMDAKVNIGMEIVKKGEKKYRIFVYSQPCGPCLKCYRWW